MSAFVAGVFSLVVKMASRNRISLTISVVSVCVLLLAVMTPAARAECDCDKPEAEQKERGAVGQFFHGALCKVKGATKSVTNTVKDGYHYVKNKLSGSESSRSEPVPESTTYPQVDLRFDLPTEEPIKLANK